jgi:hypothetical protein
MSRKKTKTENQTSIRLAPDLLEWLSVLRDGQNLSSVSEALRIALLRAYPNIEEIVAISRQQEQERIAKLGNIIPREDEG